MASKTQLKKQKQLQDAAKRQMQAQGGGMGGMGGMGDLASMMGGMGMGGGMPGMGGMGGEEAPPMPVMPDKKSMFFWKPKGDDSPQEAFDVSKFIQIWPIYINSKLTQQQGRRMPKESCCPDPTVSEMSEICQSYKLRHVLEPYRQYPRSHLKTGRVRVRIMNEDGSLCHEDITSKKDLMRQMGMKIPALNSRKKRLEDQEKKALALEASKEQSAASGGAGSGSSSNNKKKKKGKK
mmetsp:Transcript_28984/g.48914  ORF Transcript_28984/g.48914 Transcript_28984/m.48914 type:complete len:236 (+) Transcript_28984:85-792(+)